MLSNTSIKEQLNRKLTSAIADLKETSDPALLQGLERLMDYDFSAYKERLETEVRTNLRSYWTNPENGIDRAQKLDAILFEYFVPDTTGLEATAYGIIDWDDKDVSDVDVDMGYGYDFADGFEQVEGITVDFFNPYVDYQAADEDELLASCYRIMGTIAVHEVFYELYLATEFDCINKKEEFYFLLGEHDSVCYPVLAIIS